MLALGTAALYWPITSHPFIIYDDAQYVTANPHVTTGLSWTNFVWAFTNSEAANWHPLTWLSHQLDCTLFGVNAGGASFHQPAFPCRKHAAAVCFFARHHRRAVAQCVRRGAVCVASAARRIRRVGVRAQGRVEHFFLAADADGVCRGLRSLSKVQSPKSKVFYLLALVFFALGLMSKPMVVTLPFVLLLLDFWPLNRITNFKFHNFTISKSLLLEKIPFFILAAAGSAVTYLVQAGGGAVAKTAWGENLANAVLAYARYTAKIFWPTDLAIIYPHPKHWPLALALGAAAVLAVWTFLCVRDWRKSPFLAVGWLWFLGTLVPTIGLVQVGAASMADRYTYIPSIGFFIALVWGAAEFFAERPRGKIILPILGGAALLGCALTTSIQISYWRDSISLFRHAVEILPDNYAAENCLGKAYELAGDNARALVCYQAAVATEPRFPQSQFNLAMSLLALGRTDEALATSASRRRAGTARCRRAV